MSDKKLLLAQKEQVQLTPDFKEVLLFSLERRYLEFADVEKLKMTMNYAKNTWKHERHLRMMKVEEISYEGDVRAGLHLLNMQNVLAAIKEDSQNLISVIHGSKAEGETPAKTSLYYGLSERLGKKEEGVRTYEYADALRQTMHGNFLGVKMHLMTADEIFNDVLEPMSDECGSKCVCAFPGIPSLRLKDPQGPYVQGIDRFIEGMRGEEYWLVTIAEPISLPTVDDVIDNLFVIGSEVHSQVKATIAKMKGSSDTLNVGLFGMSGTSAADTQGTADTNTESTSETTGGADTTAYSKMGGGGSITGLTTAVGAAIGSIVPGIGTVIGGAIGAGVGALASWATGAHMAETAATTSNWGNTLTRTSSFTRSVSSTVGRMTGLGGHGGYARGWNRGKTVTQEALNKMAEHCEKLCNAYIERLQAGKNLGMWNAGIYLLTDNYSTQLRAQGLLRSAFSGDSTYWEPMRAIPLNNEAIMKYIVNFNNPKYDLFMYGEEENTVKEAVSFGQKIAEYAKKFGISVSDVLKRLENKKDGDLEKLLKDIRKCPGDYSKEDFEKAWEAIKGARLGHPFGDIMGGVSTPMNTEELSIIMNIPRQEVQGITIREAASFGVNYAPDGNSNGNIRVGLVVHKRMPDKSIPYYIPRELFKKHAFVCGVTGSGKTNTCMALLKGLKSPFLVVEPAKTEYRQMLTSSPDLNLKVFTLGSEMISPFRINPFEFVPGSELLTHIDSIKAVFNAAFPMYASMPYILEEAIIEIYRDKGWDLATSENRYLSGEDLLKRPDGYFYDYIPTMQDLYDKIPPIVKRKAYAQEQTENIQAALMARLSSLLTGSKGLMLNAKRSTPLSELLKDRVVLELKNIGDDDEKCFIMGLILASIYQYREHEKNALGSELKHVLLIEEAHRLLRRTPEFVSPEIGNSRGKAVETFTNVISEIREYGQGVVIVDQIPSKLTPDVVKNTNIKIIHRTLAKDDREYIGSTMNLTESQDRELCLLEVGRAVVHREGMDKAFLVAVDQIKGVGGEKHNVSDDEVHNKMKGYLKDLPHSYGLNNKEGLAEAFKKADFRRDSPNVLGCVAAALLLLMTKGRPGIEDMRKTFEDTLKRDLGICNDLQIDCHLIYNADLLFKRLQDEYGGSYKDCLEAQALFVDAWFGKIKSLDICVAVRRFTNVVKDKRHYAGVLRWIIRNFFRNRDTASDSYEVERLAKVALNQNGKIGDMDKLLRDILRSILYGQSLPPQKEKEVLVSLLDEILSMHDLEVYYRKKVVDFYDKHLAGK